MAHLGEAFVFHYTRINNGLPHMLHMFNMFHCIEMHGYPMGREGWFYIYTSIFVIRNLGQSIMCRFKVYENGLRGWAYLPLKNFLHIY